MNAKRHELLIQLPDDTIVTFLEPESFDVAIIGVENCRIVYSVEKILDLLMSEGMDHEEAVDYFCYNIDQNCTSTYPTFK